LNTLVNFRPAQPSKTGQFSTGVNTQLPQTAAQARIAVLKQSAQRAQAAVKAERKRQQVQAAQQKLQKTVAAKL
jgi:hypothetical protein